MGELSKYHIHFCSRWYKTFSGSSITVNRKKCILHILFVCMIHFFCVSLFCFTLSLFSFSISTLVAAYLCLRTNVNSACRTIMYWVFCYFYHSLNELNDYCNSHHWINMSIRTNSHFNHQSNQSQAFRRIGSYHLSFRLFSVQVDQKVWRVYIAHATHTHTMCLKHV